MRAPVHFDVNDVSPSRQNKVNTIAYYCGYRSINQHLVCGWGDEVVSTGSIFVGAPEPRKDSESPYTTSFVTRYQRRAPTFWLSWSRRSGARRRRLPYIYMPISRVNKDGRMDTERAIPVRFWSSALDKGYLCASHLSMSGCLEHYFLSRKKRKMLFIIRDPRDVVISWVDFVCIIRQATLICGNGTKCCAKRESDLIPTTPRK